MSSYRHGSFLSVFISFLITFSAIPALAEQGTVYCTYDGVHLSKLENTDPQSLHPKSWQIWLYHLDGVRHWGTIEGKSPEDCERQLKFGQHIQIISDHVIGKDPYQDDGLTYFHPVGPIAVFEKAREVLASERLADRVLNVKSRISELAELFDKTRQILEKKTDTPLSSVGPVFKEYTDNLLFAFQLAHELNETLTGTNDALAESLFLKLDTAVGKLEMEKPYLESKFANDLGIPNPLDESHFTGRKLDVYDGFIIEDEQDQDGQPNGWSYSYFLSSDEKTSWRRSTAYYNQGQIDEKTYLNCYTFNPSMGPEYSVDLEEIPNWILNYYSEDPHSGISFDLRTNSATGLYTGNPVQLSPQLQEFVPVRGRMLAPKFNNSKGLHRYGIPNPSDWDKSEAAALAQDASEFERDGSKNPALIRDILATAAKLNPADRDLQVKAAAAEAMAKTAPPADSSNSSQATASSNSKPSPEQSTPVAQAPSESHLSSRQIEPQAASPDRGYNEQFFSRFSKLHDALLNPTPESTAELQQMETTHSEFWFVHAALGKAYLSQNNFDAARVEYLKAIGFLEKSTPENYYDGYGKKLSLATPHLRRYFMRINLAELCFGLTRAYLGSQDAAGARSALSVATDLLKHQTLDPENKQTARDILAIMEKTRAELDQKIGSLNGGK